MISQFGHSQPREGFGDVGLVFSGRLVGADFLPGQEPSAAIAKIDGEL